ncbi:DUF4432 family protein [Paenibacillus sp. J5C_2022]|uniref:DUF4432 family protein n=1 Tax=Paenibacillus sp. J5C2022 TaxID=2977129 RepID=UPI0021D1D03B|nr:DUF4432 family protein [Paenibacillus sp. J5C2022]MCU6712743.1 DUF4432 family protein [Paenibacillus sp. J5C2022]
MRERNYGCRIVSDMTFKRHRAVVLENEKLQIWLLLDRGGEPARWLHKPSDTDFIWQSRLGFQPPHALYPDYQMTYPGGWQEMIPEVSYTHEYRGALVHRGEAAVAPWEMSVIQDEAEEVRIALTHQLRSLPLHIRKVIALRSGEATVRIDETVTNEAPVALETNWGYHLAYGAPFLQPGAEVAFPPGAEVIHPVTGSRWPWPEAEQDGEFVDLSRMAPAGTKRELLAIRAPEGRYSVHQREQSGLGLEVRWDNAVWPYVWYWQNFAADRDAPFFACEYNIGLEMFNVLPKLTLAEAAASGQALQLEPHGAISSWLEIQVKEAQS